MQYVVKYKLFFHTFNKEIEDTIKVDNDFSLSGLSPETASSLKITRFHDRSANRICCIDSIILDSFPSSARDNCKQAIFIEVMLLSDCKILSNSFAAFFPNHLSSFRIIVLCFQFKCRCKPFHAFWTNECS